MKAHTVPPPHHARRIVLALLAALLPSAVGCGTSIQAVFEGDVRFEHCMTLDAQPDVKREIRRACWQEWVAFYTYGQTRDRVLHARGRIRRLGAVSAFGDPSVAGDQPVPVAGAAPSSSAAAPATASASGSAARHPPSACLRQCRELADDCDRECNSQRCREGCSADYQSCLRRCR